MCRRRVYSCRHAAETRQCRAHSQICCLELTRIATGPGLCLRFRWALAQMYNVRCFASAAPQTFFDSVRSSGRPASRWHQQTTNDNGDDENDGLSGHLSTLTMAGMLTVRFSFRFLFGWLLVRHWYKSNRLPHVDRANARPPLQRPT